MSEVGVVPRVLRDSEIVKAHVNHNDQGGEGIIFIQREQINTDYCRPVLLLSVW